MSRILCVDDEPAILRLLSVVLAVDGHDVAAAANGREALAIAGRGGIDAVLLDLGLPDRDGLELIGAVRALAPVPVLVISARSDVAEKVAALDLGAADYITKPFSQRLLLARIRAVLRRASDNVMTTTGPNIIRQGHLLMDPDRHLCSWKDVEVKLTVTEFLILQALASRPGMVKNRDQLMDAAYGETIYVDDRTIDSHIKRLRKSCNIGKNRNPSCVGNDT